MNKRKGSISNTSSKSTADNTPPIIRKTFTHSNQQNSIELDDSNNDQQWHTVTSNKGQRRGTIVPRPEASEESQPIKVPSNDSGKYACLLMLYTILSSSSSCCCLILFCIGLYYRKTNDTNIIITHT